jgi:S1-C subfamily serine protease
MGIRNVELKSTASRIGGMNQATAAAASRTLWLLVIFTLLLPFAAAIPTGDPPAPYNCWLESGLTSLFDQVSPSVVRVVSHRVQQPAVGSGSSSHLRYHRLIASGVVVGPLGSVVTSARVAQPGDSISVHFPDGRTLSADYRGIDPLLNIVVLSLRSEDGKFPYLVHNNAVGSDLPEWVAAVVYGPAAGLYGGKPMLTLSTREAVEIVNI